MRSAAPTRRSPARSTAAAAAAATAPTPQTARPGAAHDGRGPTKLELCPSFAELIEERLSEDHSPEQIAGWLDSPTPTMSRCTLSHETIYRALYVQARGSLKRELTQHLRRGRSRRYARSQSSKRQGQGKITEMVMISERPPEVEDRAVPGHWEGDLLMGNRHSPAAIATLVERQTRYLQLVALPEGTEAEQVATRSRASPRCRPSCAARSPGIRVTRWPSTGASRSSPASRSTSAIRKAPGSEARTRTPTDCCASTSRRRQSLAGITQERLDEVADKLNRRPRKTLGFRTPAEKLAELINGLAGRRRALTSLRPTAFARQRSNLDGTMRIRQGWCSDRLSPQWGGEGRRTTASRGRSRLSRFRMADLYSVCGDNSTLPQRTTSGRNHDAVRLSVRRASSIPYGVARTGPRRMQRAPEARSAPDRIRTCGLALRRARSIQLSYGRSGVSLEASL